MSDAMPSWVRYEEEIEKQFDRALQSKVKKEMAHGGQVPCGVTAHGGPGGPLQFGRLEAAPDRHVPLKCLSG